MVGNDVVDFVDSEVCSGPAHPRFDARVFNRAERRALEAENDPNRLRWTFWAAKEAAYKLAVKRDPHTVFSPPRFSVTLDSATRGAVDHPGGRVSLALASRGDTVHAVARDNEAAEIVIGVDAIENSNEASAAVRNLAIRDVAVRLGVSEKDLRLGRRGRIPVLSMRGSDRLLDISLSHHGRYVAFACEVGSVAA